MADVCMPILTCMLSYIKCVLNQRKWIAMKLIE